MKYRIWSIEHNQWRKGNKSGYTDNIDSAGIYSLYKANAICFDGNILDLQEVMVPVEDV